MSTQRSQLNGRIDKSTIIKDHVIISDNRKIGSETSIDSQSRIVDSVIGDRVTVGAFAQLNGTIIGNNAIVDGGKRSGRCETHLIKHVRIVGYFGFRNASEICKDGAMRIEYRGYDSFRIATISMDVCKFLKKTVKSPHLPIPSAL